jgi:hypothetical protein
MIDVIPGGDQRPGEENVSVPGARRVGAAAGTRACSPDHMPFDRLTQMWVAVPGGASVGPVHLGQILSMASFTFVTSGPDPVPS